MLVSAPVKGDSQGQIGVFASKWQAICASQRQAGPAAVKGRLALRKSNAGEDVRQWKAAEGMRQ